jgi:hypothetical protein
VVSRYRALLIGNSTYPTDEHNLQTLKGPVKDIAALNRALIDPRTGLFADVDVTLLPEATSNRAVRALGRFFGTATPEDVLLVYFSGHGKLDHSGRLHLCMQDTDSTDLLSTAVSSTRINEFAEASRARNVVIVLDCCHAGAFRGADLGEAVAGPGRYVLTSCRGTQLANDATVENGTSLFTQHIVDGLTYAAADPDGDGYVTFSDLYAYVNRRLREADKQIPQRRVDGDGDLPLAKRPLPVPSGAGASDGPPADHAGAGSLDRPQEAGRVSPAGSMPTALPDGAIRPAARRFGRPGRKVAVALAGAAVVIIGGATAALLLTGGSGGNPGTGTNAGAGTGSYVATGPWRLKIDDQIVGNDSGCTVALTDASTGSRVALPPNQYGSTSWQIHQSGSFRWRANDPGCLVAGIAGSGSAQLPLAWSAGGDTDAFATHARLSVQVTDFGGNSNCQITLDDPSDGQPIDFQTATPQTNGNTVVLDAGNHATAYLADLNCAVRVSAAS